MKTKLFREQFHNGYPEAAKRLEEKMNAFLSENPSIQVIDVKLTSSSAPPPQMGQIIHSLTALLLYRD